MITRVEIDGFKSLRGFAVDLDPFTAIVGPNAVGKSNLFDALQLLSQLADVDVATALGTGRGSRLEQFSRVQGAETAPRIRLSVDLLLAPSTSAGVLPQTRFRYWIELARERTLAGLDKIVVQGEGLEAMQPAQDERWCARHPDLAPFARWGEPGFAVSTVEDPSPFSASHRTLRWTSDHGVRWDSLTLGTLGRERGFLAFPPGLGPPPVPLQSVGDALRGFRFLQLEPAKLRLPSERAAPTSLAPDGSNLPTALAALTSERRAEIRADLARMVPSFKSFDVVPHDDELRVEVELTSGQRLPARVLSDGTLRMLALFLILRSAGPGALIAIEEPENGVHSGSLRMLIEELVDATTPRGELPPQVLVNSHSPALVAALHPRPDSLVFADIVRRADGLHATRMRHIWREGDPRDRGATSVPMSEVERILSTARATDEVA